MYQIMQAFSTMKTVPKNNQFKSVTDIAWEHRDEFLQNSSNNKSTYFDGVLNHPKVKECISGKNEELLLPIFSMLELEEDKDYVRQYPIDSLFVVDFAFVEEKFIIEMDGKSHGMNNKKQVFKDLVRDQYLSEKGWIVLRISDESFKKQPSFYHYLIKEVVTELRCRNGMIASN